MLFEKLKTKLSLVDDYIFLSRIKDYYAFVREEKKENLSELCDGICELASQNIFLYEKIFFRLKMIDDSFEVLKMQLAQTKSVIFAQKEYSLQEELSEYKKNLQIIKKMRDNLPQKLKKLALNDYEIKFIVQKI